MDDYQASLYLPSMIGTRIRLARLAKNLSMREVGEIMNVTAQAVANWEKTKPRFPRPRAAELANVLDANLEWLEGMVGSDEQIIVSNAVRDFAGRVPIIHRHHAVLFSLFNQTDFSKLKFDETVEPTYKLKGQGFAIRISSEEVEGIYQEGDVAIFDNGIVPGRGDRVVAIFFEGDYIQTIFANCQIVDGDGPERDRRHLVPEAEDAPIPPAMEEQGGATPVAVLVELRRLRHDPIPVEKF